MIILFNHKVGAVFCSIMPVKQVLEARPDMCLMAEYPSEGRLDNFPIVFWSGGETYLFPYYKVPSLMFLDCVAVTLRHLILI